jgi:hypothetical protein
MMTTDYLAKFNCCMCGHEYVDDIDYVADHGYTCDSCHDIESLIWEDLFDLNYQED